MRPNKQSNRTRHDVVPDEYGTYGNFSRIGCVELKLHNPGDLVSPGLHHDTVVRPRERAAAMPSWRRSIGRWPRIKACDHH
jgi:hypothetical protein